MKQKYYYIFILIIATILISGCNQQKKIENTKINWFSITQKEKIDSGGGSGSSVDCVPGTQCQDVFGVGETDSIYTCTSDESCAFFKGFKGTSAGEVPQSPPPLGEASQNSDNSNEPTISENNNLPPVVEGVDACFNKEILLQKLGNLNDLEEDTSIECECGVVPAQSSGSGSTQRVEDITGAVIDEAQKDTFSFSNKFICIKKESRPDIMTDNFIFPESIVVGEEFSISFEYENIGEVGCREIYFQVEFERTINGQSEYLGGSGADILLATPFNAGDKDSFIFMGQRLSAFDVAGDYALYVMMICEDPMETHIINGLQEIHIQVN